MNWNYRFQFCFSRLLVAAGMAGTLQNPCPPHFLDQSFSSMTSCFQWNPYLFMSLISLLCAYPFLPISDSFSHLPNGKYPLNHRLHLLIIFCIYLSTIYPASPALLSDNPGLVLPSFRLLILHSLLNLFHPIPPSLLISPPTSLPPSAPVQHPPLGPSPGTPAPVQGKGCPFIYLW